ncbi:hypothetical protein [Bacillus pumilus]|uniref:hypothetical protein n=1 Tax=Bacillus pumilus TaxID=1408 RepID=UPI00192E7361|nr:hypothetical protein [Bacillus pumilus]
MASISSGLLGLIGHFIKLYKPDEDAKYFEYGSLGLFMVGVVIYLTNLRTGVNSCLVGQWGDVDYQTGINVMAASQVMIIFVLLGVLLLQGGLYYAQWYDNKLKEEFYRQEAKEAALAAESQAQQEHDIATKGKKDKAQPQGEVIEEVTGATVFSAGGVKSRRTAAVSVSTSFSSGSTSMSRTVWVASGCSRVAFQTFSRCSEKRALAAPISDSVPLRPRWLAKLESVVYTSPQRIGGPWRRVPRAATTAISRQTTNTAMRLYHGATWRVPTVPPLNGPRGRVARSAPLKAMLRISGVGICQ